MKRSYLDRPISDAVKGIALIFMFVHHFFTYPEWYVTGISYPVFSPIIQHLRWPFQICVPVFAFLTGYFYYWNQTKTYRYSLRKITDILLSYWIVYLPILALAILLGGYAFDGLGFVKELFALETPVMTFCWYVLFYCVTMLLLPLAAKFSGESLAGDILLIGWLPAAAFCGILAILGEEPAELRELVSALKDWFPCVISGYLFAKHSLFESCFDKLAQKCTSRYGKPILYVAMMAAAFLGRAVCPRFSLGGLSVSGKWVDVVIVMDVLFAPLFVYGAAKLLQFLKDGWLLKVLGRIGRQSLLMWFLHCVFFNACRETTQRILYFPRNPVLVLLFGLAICYFAAVGIDIPLKRVLKLKNKYL